MTDDNPYLALIPKREAPQRELGSNPYLSLVPAASGKFSGVSAAVDSTALEPRPATPNATLGDSSIVDLPAVRAAPYDPAAFDQSLAAFGLGSGFEAPTLPGTAPGIQMPAPTSAYEMGVASPVTQRPDRTLGELATDIGMTYRQGAREGVLGVAGAPVQAINAINTGFNSAAESLAGLLGGDAGPGVAMMDQPQWLQRMRGATEQQQADIARRDASGALMYDERSRPDTFRGTLDYVFENPGSLLTDASRTAGAMTTGVIPGSAAATIGAQAVQQASLSAQAVEESLLAKGVDQQTAKAEAAKSFATATGIGLAAPRLVPGGASFERTIAGELGDGLGSRAARIATPLLGEPVSEALEEGAIQLQQNVFSDDPTMQGVGGAAALGGLLGTGMGGTAAAVEGTRILGEPQTSKFTPGPRSETPNAPAPAAPAPSPIPVPVAPPPIEQAPPAAAPPTPAPPIPARTPISAAAVGPEPLVPDAELDDLLTRNILAPEVLEAALGDLGVEPEAAAPIAEPAPTRDERLRGLLGATPTERTQVQAIGRDAAPAPAPVSPASLPVIASDVEKTEVLPAPVPDLDDRPDPPANIRYGKPRAAPQGAGNASARAQARVDAMFAAPAEGGTVAVPKRSGRDAQEGQAGSGIPSGLPVEHNDSTRRLSAKFNGWLSASGVVGQQARFRAVRKDSLPDAVRSALTALEAATETEVVVVRNLNRTPETDFNGVSFRDGVIYVDETADNPVTTVAAHEFTHQLKADAPELYTELETEIRRQGDLPRWNEALRRMGDPNAEDTGAEELTANAVGDALTDRKFLERMAKESPSAFRKVADAFLEFLDSLIGRVRDTGSAQFLQDVEAFHDVLLDVLNRYDAGRESADGDVAPVRSRRATGGAPGTPAFQEWFGDSKVVTADGAPETVFHGTAEEFYAFDNDRGGVATGHASAPLGHFFTENRAVAEGYASNASAGVPADERVIDAYLAVSNPYDMTLAEAQAIESAEEARAIRKWLEKQGHDGIRIADAQSWIAFRPNQIKSASENTGAFDPENDDIRFSRRAASYTPEQEAFLTKAGLPVDKRGFIRRRLDGLREEFTKVKEAAKDVDALKQALFDNLHGLRAAEARLGLDDPETSPYVAARMTRGLASQMEALLTFGAPKWNGNAMSVDRNTKGLLDALKPVEGKVDEWLGWMVARRAQVLKAQGRENLMSDADIQAGLSLAGNDTTAFQQAAREYLKVKNAVLDLAQEAGLIDPQARAAWDHAEYIPFYRQEGGAAAGPGTRRGLEGQSSGIRSLKGGEQALADPLANIIRNFTRLVDAAGKNRATLLAVDRLGPTVFTPASREFKPALIPLDQVKKHLLDTGVPQSTIDTLPAGALKGVQRMLSIHPPSGEDVVRVMREGKPEYYEVSDPLVLRALTAFKEPNKSWGIKPFIFFKRLLTQGVTTTADFVAANFLRDMGSAWVISDDRFKPGWDSIKGVINTLRVDKASQDMMMAGGAFMGGNFYGGDPDAAAAALRRSLRTKGLSNRDIEGFIGTIAHTPLKLWDAYMKLSSGVENSNRRAVYDAALKAGRSPAEAAYMARDLMDFSMQGDAKFMQFFSDVLPFFNARVQGLYKLGRRAATPAGKKAILLRGSILMMGSVALYAWNVTMHGDAYDDLEEWDKDAYWHIAPGTRYHTRIPKPFEVGLAFATVPERMLEAIRFANTGEEGDTPSETWDALVRAITGTLAFNPIPQAALPVVEQWANKRFFTGRPIESQGDDKLLPEAREEWYTSDTAKKIAKVLPESGPAALSAKRIQHLWQGYTGGMGAYVLDASDWVVRQLDDAPVRPTVALRDFPVMGRFLRGDTPAPSKAVGEFYDRLSRAEQVEGTIKEYFVRDASDDAAKAGDLTDRALELQRKNAALLGPIYYSKRLKAGFGFRHIQAMRKVRTQLAGLKQEAEDIINSTKLSAEQKREQLDANTVKRNKLARDMVGKLKDARKTPDDKANDGDADAGQE